MISRQYMAGFFDGEGCVNLTVTGKVRQVQLRLMIVNTDPEILQEISLTFGGRLQKPRVSKQGWKSFRMLKFTGKEAFEFLCAIFPYSIVKRRQIKLALEFWEFQHLPKAQRCDVVYTRSRFRGQRTHMVRKPDVIEKELMFKSQMHELNRKGSVQ